MVGISVESRPGRERKPMRTTLNIADDVLERVKQYAVARAMPAGEAASYLLN